MNPLRRWFRGGRSTSPVRRRNRLRPGVEGLETRVVLYSASGNAWPDPQTITISFMPDGTSIGGGYASNLFSTFDNTPGLAGNWQNLVLKAAQAWAQQTNINFVEVPDNGAPQGSGADQQGDPGFGDIRIGGFNFGDSTLALTYQPPPVNNFDLAGDVAFNTGQHFHNNTTYDLYSVAMHEIGHALGLNESSVAGSVMYPMYTGIKKGLTSDDISGIRSIYSSNNPRTPDAYNGNGHSNGSESSSTQISNANTTALLQNLDITTAGQAEYFAFTDPAGSSTVNLDVQSAGLSLLAPQVTAFAPDGSTVLASATASGSYQGATLTLALSGLTANSTYYIKVQGADTTAMGTGRYALALNFAGGAPPAETSPIVAIANGNPTHFGGGQAQYAGAIPYASANPSITGITPDNGVSNTDGITNNPQISIVGTAPAGDSITVYSGGQAIGQTVAQVNNTWTLDNTANPLPDGDYLFTAVATDGSGYSMTSAAYEVVIDTHVPAPPTLADISPDNGLSPTDGVTDVNTPTFSGTAEPFDVVSLYANGSSTPFGTTEADISGNWSFTVGQAVKPGSVAVLGSLLTSLLSLGRHQAPGIGPEIPDGTYQITARAMDVAGTQGVVSSSMTIVIDTRTPPTPKVTGISPDTGRSSTDGVTTAHNLTISGKAQPGDLVTVLINGAAIGTTTPAGDGLWTFDDTATTLPDGTYAITATAMSLAGDLSNASAPFHATIETVAPPTIAGVSLVQGPAPGLHGNQQGLSLIGTAPANDQVRIYLDGNLIGTTRSDGQGDWSYMDNPPSNSVAAATYDFRAVAVDGSGNASAATARFPLVVGSGPTAGAPQYASGVLSGLSTPGSLVTIVDGDVIIGVVTADASGNWQFTPALSKGHHTIRVDAADASGNTSLLSSAITVST